MFRYDETIAIVWSWLRLMFRFVVGLIFLLTGCNIIPIEELTPIATALPDGLEYVQPIHTGICFEGAWDAAGQVFVFRNAEEHIRFYNLADNSGLCRRPVTRHPFDFTQGDALAGLWSRGRGCVARHDILDVNRDNEAQSIQIVIDFVTEGDCPYDLVRGFWISIPNAQDFAIEIQVVD